MTDPIAISALEHHRYCPRQAALIHLDGIWQDNAHTIRGRHDHKRVDTAGHRLERGRQVLRGINLWSARLGLIGRADTIHLLEDGTLEPVEYKAGTPHGDCAEIQLCAQALCLEEMTGAAVNTGHIWFRSLRRRRVIPMTKELRQHTIETIAALHQQLRSPTLPPSPNDTRCNECQLAGHCLPAVVANPASVQRYMEQQLECIC